MNGCLGGGGGGGGGEGGGEGCWYLLVATAEEVFSFLTRHQKLKGVFRMRAFLCCSVHFAYLISPQYT